MHKLTASWARSAPGVDISSLVPMAKLARVGLLLTAFQDEQLAPYGLRSGDYSVLAALRRSGQPYRLSPSELYNVLECSSGGMTKMLKRLEARGLIERVPDPSDGRSNPVSLTSEGRRFERKVFDTLLAGTRDLLAPMSAAQLRDADRSLEQLLGCFERHFYR
jgi:DNA-binding MarR family transcriptional regulator